MSMKRVGTIVFVVGLVLAVLLGAVADLFIESVIVAFFTVIVLLGLVVGILTSAKEETEDVLYTTAAVAVTALAATSVDNIAPEMFGSFIVGAAHGVIAYLFAVALVVGAKRIWDLGTGF